MMSLGFGWSCSASAPMPPVHNSLLPLAKQDFFKIEFSFLSSFFPSFLFFLFILFFFPYFLFFLFSVFYLPFLHPFFLSFFIPSFPSFFLPHFPLCLPVLLHCFPHSLLFLLPSFPFLLVFPSMLTFILPILPHSILSFPFLLESVLQFFFSLCFSFSHTKPALLYAMS